MKRLLICTPTYSTTGGVERILESLSERLPKHDFEVIFGLAKGRRFQNPERFCAAYPKIESVTIDGTAGTASGRRRSMRKVIEGVDPDVVLAARLFDTLPVAADLKHEGHRLRLAVMIQGFEPEYFVDAHRYREFIDLCNTSGSLIATAVTRICEIPPKRVVAIAGGVRPPKRHRRPSEILRLGYAGRITTLQKRALDLVDVLRELRRRGVPFQCRIAGSGPQEEELRATIAQAGLGDAVEFLGWQSSDELYERVYPELDVLLHFAEWEGIPIAPREAMAHGVVPVMARFIGFDAEDHFHDGADALTFMAGDTKAAADSVGRLNADRQMLERLSAAARVSQTGIRSEEGAAHAWGCALHETLERNSRIGALPRLPRSRNRLDRLMPAAAADMVRRLLPRNANSSDPGSEWPHWSGDPDPAVSAALRALAETSESRHFEKSPADCDGVPNGRRRDDVD